MPNQQDSAIFRRHQRNQRIDECLDVCAAVLVAAEYISDSINKQDL
jgi:hypothetical protein